MRIVYSHRTQSRDGQSVHIEAIVSALRQLGHDVLVVGPTLYERAAFGGESAAVRIIRRYAPRVLLELAELAYSIPAARRLHRACRDFAPEAIYERYNLYYLAGALVRCLTGIPLLLEVNSPICEERSRHGGLALRPLAAALQRWVWRSADVVFVVTGVLREIVVAAGVARDRVAVVPNAIDPAMFPPEPYRASPGGAVTIGFVGFIRDWHGLDQMIEGLARRRGGTPVRLVVVGDGPARAALQQQAAARGVEDLVDFLGLQPRSAVQQLIRRFDIAVQPSVVPYASPLKIFEYMACGRAIVAPDQPNIREILSDGDTALLFDPAEPGALWRAIWRLADDPHLRERLGLAARRALDAAGYTWRRNAARITAAAADASAVADLSIALDRR